MTININGTTGISGVDGSAGTPAIQGSDTNTGVFFGTNTIDLSTDGTSRLSIDSSGNVGIGTTTTNWSLLDGLIVQTGNGSAGVNIASANSTDNAYLAFGYGTTHADQFSAYVGRIGDDTLSLGTANTERARIDSSGRLLIGTTSARDGFYNGSNSTALQVEGSGDAGRASILRSDANGALILGYTPTASNGNSLGVVSYQGNDGGGFVEAAHIRCEVDGTPGSDDMPGRLMFATTADGASSPTERMRLNSSGYLDCHQGAGAAFGDNAHAFRRDNTSDTYVAKFIHEGTSTPKGLYIQYRNASPNTTGAQFLLCVDNNGSTFARIDSNGGLANFQSNNSNLCDEREKKNIVNLDSTWDCLKEWELKKFHYNNDADDSDLRYGVIAQQIATSCPEVITNWFKQEAAEAVLDEDGNELEPAREEIVRMGVKEQQMMWMAIKALQEAQTRIETLEARLSVLEGGAN